MPKQTFSQRLEDISANLESLANEIVAYAQDVRNSQTMQESPTPEAYLGTLRYDALLQTLKSELAKTRAELERARHNAERYKKYIDDFQEKNTAKRLRNLKSLEKFAVIFDENHRPVYLMIQGVLFKGKETYFLIGGEYYKDNDPRINHIVGVS